MTKKLSYLFVSAGVFALDQWTKWMIEVHLPHHASTVLVPGFFNLTHVRNTGVAFGLFASTGGGSVWMLTALGLVALAAVGVYFWHAPHRDRSLLIALSLVVGGALGNLADRISSGAVTDFIDLYLGTHHWPSFNVADIAISAGILVMAIDGLRHRKHGEAHLKAPAPAPEA